MRNPIDPERAKVFLEGIEQAREARKARKVQE
jgi:hypothetical protein